MLPEKLSTEITSLLEGEDRLAVVIDLIVDSEGTVRSSDVYRAMIRNYAKLDYESVGQSEPVNLTLEQVEGIENKVQDICNEFGWYK